MMFAGVSAAGAYISAVEIALGSSITSTQKAALNAFVLAEQAAARWTSHKRLYFPIWGNAAANAICLKSLTSGTFAGAVTHGAGYVQSDGTTGYFNLNTNATTLATPAENAMVFALEYQGPSGAATECALAGLGSVRLGDSSGTKLGELRATTNRVLGVPAIQAGIFTISSTSSTFRALRHRRQSGVASLGTNTGSLSGSNGTTLYALARNNSGLADQFHTGRLGAFGLGNGLDTTATDAFTANLKTLWETCTGLTLP